MDPSDSELTEAEIMDLIVEAVELDEGCVPSHGVVILSYVMPDGTEEYGWVSAGGSGDEILALLWRSAHRLLHLVEDEDDHE